LRSPLLVSLARPALLVARLAVAQDFQQRPPEPPPPEKPAPRLTKQPKLETSVEPAYPPAALSAGLSADVTLQLDLDAEGNVTAVAVTKPAGNGFDEAARDAALQFHFSPAEGDGQPSAIRIEYVQHFRPKAVEAAPPPPPAPPPSPPPPPPDQRVLVRGRMREKGTRDPIAGAAVSVVAIDGAVAAELFAITDDDGHFQVTGAAPAGVRLRLVLSSGEHEACVREVRAPEVGAAVPEINCLVQPHQVGQYETVVINPGEGENATKHTISQAEMTTVPGTFGDPLRVIQNLPGVARSPYGLGLLIIRGSSPQDSGVFVDGHKVPILYHFLGGPSVLTPDLIDKIDFYPGGFGVKYGRATAGVVDVTTRNESLRRVHGSADVDLIDSSAYLEGPLGNDTSGGIAARRSYIDLLLPLFIPKREGSTNVVVTPVYYDYQARVTHALASGGRLALFVFGSEDSLKVLAEDPARGNIDLGTTIGFHRVIGSYATSFGPWTSLLSPAWGYDHFGFGVGQIAADAKAQVLGLREEVSRPIGRRLKLALGFDGELRFDGFTVNAPLPPERRTYGRAANADVQGIDRQSTNLGSAVYAEALWDVSEHVRIVPGLRGDWFHYNGVDRWSGDPRVVVNWQRTPRQKLVAGAGVFHQPPQPQELDSQFGNPKLKPLWADQYHVGIEQGFTLALSLEATLYYLRRHDLPVPSSARDASGRIEVESNQGVGRGYGLELRLRHAVTSNFYGWISYTLARSEAILAAPGTQEAAAGYRPTDFDQTHNFILVASRRFGAWELGTRFRLVSGVPETPILGSTYDADFNSYDPVSGTPRSVRRQLFHQLDVRLERTFTFDWWRFSAYVDVQNVYNAQNPEATLYNYRYSQSGPVRGLPLLPILGLRGRF
jgi:TonB family protein